MRIPSRPAMFTSLVSGQAAGLSMLAMAMCLAVLRGKNVLYPLQVFTALVVGEPALHQVSMSSVLPGLLAHQLGPSVLWSKVFGLVVGLSPRRFRRSQAVLLGALVGVLALLIDGSVLMPGIQRQLNGHNLWAENVPRWVSWMTHLTYGVALGWFYWRWQPPPSQDRPDAPRTRRGPGARA
ncbi:hypothetical protein [Vitiosangium sp. GDMCC 1.1324]|uniref:hypothetical protein n=1 Tax=Vitiosangium sp. (strain GDMCC 1.1324) TaxID=2138576 RepID=UPI0011B4D51E|nr:hypothetical protein [Vitiosangium sp. GDMCC 1.1324]